MKMKSEHRKRREKKDLFSKRTGGKCRLSVVSKLLSFEKIKPIDGSKAKGGTIELQ